MDVYHVGEFAERGMFTHQDRDLLNDVGTMGAIGMTTQNHPISIAEEFQHTLRGIHGERLAVGTPKGFLAGVGNALCFELVLSGADTGSLGFSEDGCGHDVEADIVLLAENMVDSTDGLHLSGMGEHLTTVDIADGV